LRVLVLGAGAVTRIFYVPAFRKGLDGLLLAAVVDRSAAALEHLGTMPGSVRLCVTGIDEALADSSLISSVDMAIVALPHVLHETAVTKALQAGLHVFSEKPLGMSEAEVQRMISAAEAAERRLGVCQPRRSLPAVGGIARMLSSEALGTVRRVSWDEGQPYAWPAQSLAQVQHNFGGSELHDIGAHAFDVLCQWFGPMSVARYADDGLGGTPAEFEVDLVAQGELRVDVRLSRLRHLAQQVRIEGDRGVITWPLRSPDTFILESQQLLGLPNVEIKLPADGKPRSIYDAVHYQLHAFGRDVAGAEPLENPAESVLPYARIFDQCAAMRPSAPLASAPATTLHYVVVGAAGFIGCALVEALLQHGHRVTALVHRPASAVRLLRRDVHVALCDVSRPDTYRDHIHPGSVVINCAVSQSGDDLEKVIIQGALALLESAQARGARRVVLLSSMLAYGDPPVGGVVDEASPKGTSLMLYALAKAQMEQRCQQWASVNSMPLVILQPTCVYGPHAKDFGSAPLADMLAGSFMLFDEGHAVANLVYVDNLVDAILLASEKPLASGSRYIVNEESEQTTWAAFYGTLAQAAFRVPAASFTSIGTEDLASLCRIWRRRHSFPEVLREAVRSSPAATDWLAGQGWFNAWRAMRSRAAPQVAAPPQQAEEPPVAMDDAQVEARRELRARLLAQRRLFVNESTARFFTTSATYSSARIRSELGWAPRVPRADALQATAVWAAHAYEHRQMGGSTHA
jgi:predicted dehydrogenase/nucleoside-diphosphate-sugar epimerase